MQYRPMQMCSRCIYDARIPGITFDEEGVCSYCTMSDRLKEQYGTGKEKGEAVFREIIQQIKEAGKGKPYDCIVGVSGGVDSSMMLHYSIKWGLRPLAVHYDNTWNTSVATENLRKVLSQLKVDLHTYVIDNKESDNIFKSFFYADVPEIDAPTDLAIAEILYRVASQYGVSYILEGHSFLQEGISPLSTMYFDGMYIKDIYRKFGAGKFRTYPFMDFKNFMKWTVFKRIKKIRPFWYIHYSKEEAIKLLEAEYGWQYYGGHHLENRISDFMHIYYLPHKFNIDQRNNSLSAMVRIGYMLREEALAQYATPPYVEPQLLEYFRKRLSLSEEEFENVMHRPAKSFVAYKTYKRRFEMLKPLFYILAKANLVPMSFYLKYCFPVRKEK